MAGGGGGGGRGQLQYELICIFSTTYILDVHDIDIYEASCYSSKNENKVPVVSCRNPFHWGGGGGLMNIFTKKRRFIREGAYQRGGLFERGLNRENTLYKTFHPKRYLTVLEQRLYPKMKRLPQIFFLAFVVSNRILG